ncbi:MAG: hypothetical protein AAFQ32_04770 [Pseudomonadota bacterium]
MTVTGKDLRKIDILLKAQPDDKTPSAVRAAKCCTASTHTQRIKHMIAQSCTVFGACKTVAARPPCQSFFCGRTLNNIVKDLNRSGISRSSLHQLKPILITLKTLPKPL